MKKTMFAVTLAVALAGCAGGQQAASDKEYDALVATAKAEIELAKKSGQLWNNTEKFMKEADEAMKAGQRDKAMKLVRKATKEAQGAQKQAKDNASIKPIFN